MNDRPRILITGASGFTGQHACRYFIEKGWDVIAVVHTNKPKIQGLRFVSSDLTVKKDVFLLIDEQKPDYVLHLAGMNAVSDSWEKPLAYIEANAISTLYLLESIRKVNRQIKVVIVSSVLQYDPVKDQSPMHPYSFSKTLQAQIGKCWCSLFDLDIVIAQPSNLIGPGPSKGICSLIAKKLVEMEKGESSDKVIHLNDINAQRDFLDVRDAVKAYDLLLYCGEIGKTYKISSGKIVSLQEIISHYQTLTNTEFVVKTKQPYGDDNPVLILSEEIKGLGWKPYLSLPTSLNDTINYYREADE